MFYQTFLSWEPIKTAIRRWLPWFLEAQPWRGVVLASLLTLGLLGCSTTQAAFSPTSQQIETAQRGADAVAKPPNATIYQQSRPSSDGIGKIYQGREIAQVMGHQGAAWLERSSREAEEQPRKVIEHFQLKPTDVVADIGAGTGYFSFRIAPKVPQGQVLAVDIQPEMLETLERLKTEKQLPNVQPVLGTVSDPHLPDRSIDLAFMVDAYHEFEFPWEMMQAIVKALKPGGRVVLVEYRGEDPFVMIKPLHKMTQKQARREMAAVQLQYMETKTDLPQQHVMIFRKSA